MIDPENPTTTPIVVEAGNTAVETAVLDGTLDIPAKSITGVHTRTIIYANTDDGKLYKISALKSDAQTPVQVSNETGASGICGSQGRVPDLSDHGKSVFFYRLPGDDTFCSTEDDVLKMVRLEMSASDSPINALGRVTELLDPGTGAINGFLARVGTDLAPDLVVAIKNLRPARFSGLFQPGLKRLRPTFQVT